MQLRWKSFWSGALALVVFALLLGRTLVQESRAPALNWDLVPVMGLALEWEVKDPVELHRRTYERLREELPPEVFQDLATGAPVRAARYRDPSAFHEHLAFYRSRVLYTLAVYWLYTLGAPLSGATWWVSLAAFALVSALVLAWSGRHLALPLAALFALGLAHTPALLNQASYSTADGLATLIVCLGAYVLVERRRFVLGAAILTLSLAARPDGIILIGFLAAALFLVAPPAERPTLRALALWLGLSAALYLGLSRFAGDYGWWPLFHISFEAKEVHPAALPSAVDWGRYGEVLGRQIDSIPGNGYVRTAPGSDVITGSTLALWYAALALLGLALGWRTRAAHARELALLAALLATYLVRFLLFPQIWDRFFVPLYVLVPLCGLAMLARELAAPRPAAPSPAP